MQNSIPTMQILQEKAKGSRLAEKPPFTENSNSHTVKAIAINSTISLLILPCNSSFVLLTVRGIL